MIATGPRRILIIPNVPSSFRLCSVVVAVVATVIVRSAHLVTCENPLSTIPMTYLLPDTCFRYYSSILSLPNWLVPVSTRSRELCDTFLSTSLEDVRGIQEPVVTHECRHQTVPIDAPLTALGT